MTEEKSKRAQIVAYFYTIPKSPKSTTTIAGLGLLALIFGTMTGAALIFAGVSLASAEGFTEEVTIGLGAGVVFLLIAAGGLAIAVVAGKKGGAVVRAQRERIRTIETKLDGWLDEDIDRAKKKALESFGLSDSDLVRESEAVTGVRHWETKGLVNEARKVGTDKVYRYSPIAVILVMFGSDQLLIYEFILDFLTGKTLKERSAEFFNKDVVSVMTKNDTLRLQTALNTPLVLKDANIFEIATSGGTNVSLVLDYAGMLPTGTKAVMGVERTEKAMLAIRQRLRESIKTSQEIPARTGKMFCKYCGEPNASDALRCTACGGVIGE